MTLSAVEQTKFRAAIMSVNQFMNWAPNYIAVQYSYRP